VAAVEEEGVIDQKGSGDITSRAGDWSPQFLEPVVVAAKNKPRPQL